MLKACSNYILRHWHSTIKFLANMREDSVLYIVTYRGQFQLNKKKRLKNIFFANFIQLDLKIFARIQRK